MKNKIIITTLFLLTMNLCACSQPTNIYYNNVIDLSSLSEDLTISNSGEYSLEGELNGQIYIAADDVILNLNGVTVKNSDGPAVFINGTNTKIYLEKDSVNNLIDGEKYINTDLKGTIFSDNTLLIDGEGELNISSNYNDAIHVNDITINNGNINILESNNDGINVDNISIINGMINITAADDGIQSNGPLLIEGGSFTINSENKGISSEDDLTINTGIININSQNEGIESKSQILINNAKINISSVDDGINATNNIEINDGTIIINSSKNDAIDSNGTLIINGGYIDAVGSTMPEGGLDCDTNNVQINGGTIIASGGENSLPKSKNQYSLLIGSVKCGQTITITKCEEILFEYSIIKDSSNVLLSLPEIETNNDYKILIDNEEYFLFTAEDTFIIEAGGTINNGFGQIPQDFKEPLETPPDNLIPPVTK